MEKDAAMGSSCRSNTSADPPKPSLSEMIRESDGSQAHPQERRPERRTKGFREHLSPSSPTGLQSIPESGTAQEVTVLYHTNDFNGAGLIENSREPGPDVMTPSFFKDDGEVLI